METAVETEQQSAVGFMVDSSNPVDQESYLPRARDLEQELEKNDHEKPHDPRCKTCGVAKSGHDRWIESLDGVDRHNFAATPSNTPTAPDERRRNRRNWAVQNRYQGQKKAAR
jgi:hypothetical protein